MPAGGGLIESVFQSVFITNPQNRRGVMKEFSRLKPFSSVQTMDQLGEENTHTHTHTQVLQTVPNFSTRASGCVFGE